MKNRIISVALCMAMIYCFCSCSTAEDNISNVNQQSLTCPDNLGENDFLHNDEYKL